MSSYEIPTTEPASVEATTNFITQIVDADLDTGAYAEVVTRFPPEPNGYLHVGHAKSICLNFGLALQYGGRCHLRMDDTNPLKEETEYVEAIKRDIRWLGFDWGEHMYYASDYFGRLYDYAVLLVNKGLAYVDDQDVDQIREGRGTLSEPGTPSPWRDRSPAENLDLLARMRDGEFEDGSRVLRAKIDMASPNMLMRDPLMYRIRHATHHNTGDDWCIYPMYDFAHGLSDAIEGVTHSICTLEFENNRELYDWFLDHCEVERPRPKQIEFARLALDFVMTSKRKLLQLVSEGHVSGWDDPRMPTIAGMRRAGYTPESIRTFATMVGVAKANSQVDWGKLQFAIRDDLNHRAPRVMGVLDPLEVVIDNYPKGESEELEAPYWPPDVPREGSRIVPFSRRVYIERSDFMEDPPKGFYRLAPGREVRLKYAYYVTCKEVVRDDAGEVVRLVCTYDPETRGGGSPDGRKVRGTLHWVSAEHAVPCEVRLYEPLFTTRTPSDVPEGKTFLDLLNPESLTVVQAFVEPSMAGSEAWTRVQFERHGYFMTDPGDSRPDALVFNRIVALKDSWARQQAESTPAPPPDKKKAPSKPKPDTRPSRKPREDVRDKAREEDPELAARYRRYQGELGLPEDDADILTGDRSVATFFDAAVAAGGAPQSVANWVVNEVLRVVKDQPLESLPFGGAAVGELMKLVDDDTISGSIAKDVFDEMVDTGDAPAAIVERRGLEQITDAARLQGIVDGILREHPDEVAAFRGGKKSLLGFFIGQAMQATRGKANPQLVRELLMKALQS